MTRRLSEMTNSLGQVTSPLEGAERLVRSAPRQKVAPEPNGIVSSGARFCFSEVSTPSATPKLSLEDVLEQFAFAYAGTVKTICDHLCRQQSV